MTTPSPDPFSAAKRIDLHCHSIASNRPAEAMLKVLNCPECYSEPQAVYQQARSRGMDFVTITDHDCIDGVLQISNRDDVLVGEELTCWFPEDECKMHVVMWGITPEHHEALQAMARDIYRVAEYLEAHRIAHAVAHPIYRQNDKLERWHLERLMLLFKGFECLNGAHSPLHREAFEPLLDDLSPEAISKLSEKHRLRPRWPEPHLKARTGGSDDHGLLNIGRTYTEFPSHVKTAGDLLECIRTGACRPGGEAGSTLKLAHTFYSVAVRYYSRHIMAPGAKPNLPAYLLQMLVGERAAPSRSRLTGMLAGGKAKRLLDSLIPPIFKRRPKNDGIPTLRDLFVASARQRIAEHPHLLETLKTGLPPLGEHEAMFSFVSSINRDISSGIAQALSRSIDTASFTGLFNTIAAILGHQFALSPYYFALFHQNKERRLLQSLTGQIASPTARTLRVGLFTDTLDDINGVSRFLQDMAARANQRGCRLTIHTCTAAPRVELPCRMNFKPLLSEPLPYYPEILLNLPPVLEVLEFAEKQQYDAIHVSTPGPMGLCGLLVAKMLRIPCVATYHTDFPTFAHDLTGDHRVVSGTSLYMRWFYQRMAHTFARSREYRLSLESLIAVGASQAVAHDRLSLLPPAIDTSRFNPAHADPAIWAGLKVTQPRRLLYVGRLSIEKNLPLLAAVFKRLCEARADTALVLAGDGPYRAAMEKQLAGLPAHFLGYQDDTILPALYASADMLVFPSRSDTLGQAVMEAQASGLPVLVSDEGGPREMTADNVTGLVLPPTSADAWLAAITALLDDPARLASMAKNASPHMQRLSLDTTFDHFWSTHLRAATCSPTDEPARDALPLVTS